MKPIDLTVIINLHNEGEVCRATFASVNHAARIAAQEGFRIEVLALLDSADDTTQETAAEVLGPIGRMETVQYRDLGASRNAAVASAQGRFLSFIDGDDLFHSNWLRDLLLYEKNQTDKVIWHPQYNFYFGDSVAVFEHIDMEDPRFQPEQLCIDNYWTALAAAPKAVFEAFPYIHVHKEAGIGLEDWAWNMATIGGGYLHKCVPNTWHGIRSKSNGSMLDSTRKNKLMAPFTAEYKDWLIRQNNKHETLNGK